MNKNLMLLCLMLVVFGNLACEGPQGDTGPQGPGAPFITVEPSAATIQVGQSQQFSATTSTMTEAYTWRSSNPSIATVDQTGKVTGLSSGIVFINVTGNESKATQNVNVTVEQALVSEISFAQHILPMFTQSN
ncbi:MAG: Ig-like domain-containing protein, partial [bacterium]